jgi:folylpolyglutamate synthase/dihydropteroate synthase
MALVISVVGDKDVDGVLAPLLAAPAGPGGFEAGFAAVLATRSHNRRALHPDRLAEAIARHAPAGAPRPVTPVADPLQAVVEARSLVASPDRPGLAVVAGSIFLVGEVRAALLSEPTDPVPVADPL